MELLEQLGVTKLNFYKIMDMNNYLTKLGNMQGYMKSAGIRSRLLLCISSALR